MRELVNDLNKARAVLEEKLKVWVTDKTIPLNERWEVFVEAGLGSTDGRSYDALGEDYFMYDGEYHCDRYQTVELVDVIDRAEEEAPVKLDKNGVMLVGVGGLFILTDESIEKLNTMKEQILKDFIWAFTYDW